MRIALRADASTNIGFGHVARCLALAEALVHDGHVVALLGADLPGVLGDLAGSIGVTHLRVEARRRARRCRGEHRCDQALGRRGGVRPRQLRAWCRMGNGRVRNRIRPCGDR